LLVFFFFSSRRRHTRSKRDWSSDVCSSDLEVLAGRAATMAKSIARLHPEEAAVLALLQRRLAAAKKARAAAPKTVREALERSLRSEERRVGKEGRARGARDE